MFPWESTLGSLQSVEVIVMKATMLCGWVATLCFATVAMGQTVILYQEDFSTAGADGPLSSVGWADDIPAANPNRLVAASGGYFWAYEPAPPAGVTNSTAFYTSTALDTGATGPAFTPINPAAYLDIQLRTDIRDFYSTDFMAARFAIQMNASAWYASTNVLPVPVRPGAQGTGGTWAGYTQTFDPAASAWFLLTVSGDGSGTNAVLGAAAPADLTGEITGGGVVVSYWENDGTYEFDNFQIRGTPFGEVPPTITVQPPSRSAYESETVHLDVTAEGTPPLSYQWRKDGAPLADGERISGSLSNELTLASVIVADAGGYSVVVQNNAGAVTSQVALLTISPAPVELLYEETFPYVGTGGDVPVSTVGWLDAINSNSGRIYGDATDPIPGSGRVFAYEGGADVSAFYATIDSDSGDMGLAFPTIDPDAYPFVTLSMEVQPSFNPENVSAYMAVRMGEASGGGGALSIAPAAAGMIQLDWLDGALQGSPDLGAGADWVNVPSAASPLTIAADQPSQFFRTEGGGDAWFVATEPLPINPGLTGTFTRYYHAFARDAAGWNVLTLSTVPPVIGGPAAADLAGPITGAGVVFVHSAAGTLDFDNFRMTTNQAPANAPVIVWLPQAFTAYEGAGVSFAVDVIGTPPFTYQWSQDFDVLADGGRISGAATNLLSISAVTPADSAEYSVLIENAIGSDDSFNRQIHEFTVESVPAGLLYAERFPFVGPGAASKPLALVGWAAAVPGDAARLYKVSPDGTSDGEGAAFAFQDGPATTLLYTTAALDTGASGLPFLSLSDTTYPNLEVSVQVAPSFNAANVTARAAVQINDSDWYAAAEALPVPTEADSEEFLPYAQGISRTAAGWNTLTVSATGAEIGDPAGADLSGPLTGAGILFTHTGPGTFNIDSFEIRQAP